MKYFYWMGLVTHFKKKNVNRHLFIFEMAKCFGFRALTVRSTEHQLLFFFLDHNHNIQLNMYHIILLHPSRSHRNGNNVTF